MAVPLRRLHVAAGTAVAAARAATPPAATHRLVTIRFSHYNEKARWALDFYAVAFEESAWLPGLHVLGLALNGGGPFTKAAPDRVSTRWSTPFLVTDAAGAAFVDKAAPQRPAKLHDSRAITRYVDARFSTRETTLYPHADAAALEERYHDYLGPHTRRLAYAHLLPDEDLFFAVCRNNVGAAQYAAVRASFPLMRRFLSGLGLTAERVAKSQSHIDKEFDAVAARLEAEGSDFLVSHTFSAADLTFAALAAPVLMVQPHEGYGAWFPPIAELSEPFQQIVVRYRSHPAGQHAMRMFRTHRGTRVRPGLPPLPPDSLEPPHDMPSRPSGSGKTGGPLGPGVV